MILLFHFHTPSIFVFPTNVKIVKYYHMKILNEKVSALFHAKIFTKLFSFFVRQRKIKTKKENTKSFLQKKIGIRIPTPPFTLHFHFPFIFTFFIFLYLTKSKKYHATILSLFSHFISDQS